LKCIFTSKTRRGHIIFKQEFDILEEILIAKIKAQTNLDNAGDAARDGESTHVLETKTHIKYLHGAMFH
jgi:hypothetical protein